MRTWMNSLASAAALTLLTFASVAGAQSPSTVLVVANRNNAQSMALANYYLNARKIPTSNLFTVDWTASDNADTCSLTDYTSRIQKPIYARIAQLPRIDYIVLCRNLPVRITDTGNSVDSTLACRGRGSISNPYYASFARFSSLQYKMYLVTRLDGWSWSDAQALVDHSLAAQKGAPFFFDIDPCRGMSGGYGFYNNLMLQASQMLNKLSIANTLDNTTQFCAPTTPLGGYISWGSNDANFRSTAFCGLKFAPGAIAETAVSTGASNVRYPGGWQSQVAQLVRNGVTGVKGYVTEPGIGAVAAPHVLAYMYTTGYNLAESFYMASSTIGWKDVVIGDPLCSPYKP